MKSAIRSNDKPVSGKQRVSVQYVLSLSNTVEFFPRKSDCRHK